METFDQTVKKLRKAKKLTQLELAEKIGVDFTYISKIENDRTMRFPSEFTLTKLAEVLEINSDKLILLANKIPQNLHKTVVQDNLAVDFLRTVSKFNDEDRAEIRNLIHNVENRN